MKNNRDYRKMMKKRRDNPGNVWNPNNGEPHTKAFIAKRNAERRAK